MDSKPRREDSRDRVRRRVDESTDSKRKGRRDDSRDRISKSNGVRRSEVIGFPTSPAIAFYGLSH